MVRGAGTNAVQIKIFFYFSPERAVVHGQVTALPRG
jgi:hypothetical protein